MDASQLNRWEYWVSTALVLSFSLCYPVYGSDDEQAAYFYETLTTEQQQWLSLHPQIRVAAMNDWPPMSFINNKGEPDGIGVDYINALNLRLEGRLTLSNGKWSDIYQSVVDGQSDVLMDITPKPEREADFEFTQPYMEIPHVIIALDDAPLIGNETGLIGKTVALEQGFGNVSYFKTNYPEVEIREYANTSEALGAVSLGEADAYVGNRAVALYIIGGELIGNLKIHSRAQKNGSILALGVRKDWAILAEILDLAIDDLSSAEITRIQRNWVGDVDGSDVVEQVQLTPEEQAWLQEHSVIRLASSAKAPPYEYFDSEGRYQGIAADYMALLEKKLNITFDISPIAPWSQIVDRVQDRELDVLSLAMATPFRQSFASFTEPYISTSVVIVTQNDMRSVIGLEGLKDKSVAMEKGYALVDTIRKQHPEILFNEYATTADALKAVANGTDFAYLGNIATVSYHIRENSLANLVISGETSYRYDLSMGVRSDWPELVGILNKGLNSISDQERSEILSRWIQVEVTNDFPVRWLIAIGVLVTLIVAVVLYWNFLLNKKVIERTRLLEHRAMHDVLTDLPNRLALINQIEQLITMSKRNKTLLAVLFLDLDDFKKVNDTLGHKVGDQLLLSIANRLRQKIRVSDTVGRMGGDEFVVVLSELKSIEQVSQVAQLLLKAMQEDFEVEKHSLMMTTSIGISVYPQDSGESEQLLERSDTAMYHAKKKGGNEFAFFDSDMNSQQQKRLLIENHLSEGLQDNQFNLVYQPIIDLVDNKIKGFEALLRWHSPQLGQVAPDEFISIAERNGFILQLGNFVLQQSIEDLQRLKEKYQSDFSMSINLSPRQVRDDNLLKLIHKLVVDSNLEFRDLIFEITEGVLLSHEQQSGQVLNDLKALGVSIAMDDFGSGYSSLSYVRNYPFDRLKIDREFVRDMAINKKDRQLVEATIAMASSLDIVVVAEGVETDAQYDALKETGCCYAQGYFVSKPLPYDQLCDWLDIIG